MPRRTWTPRCDILETDAAIVVVADMPGVDHDGVEITLDKGVLNLRGTVVDDRPQDMNLLLGEYDVADYARSFTLPDAIDAAAVSAQVANGVLTLTLPKATSAQPRRIEVKAG